MRAPGPLAEADLRDLLTYASGQPLVLDALAEADRIAAMTPPARLALHAGGGQVIVVVDPGVAIKWFVEEPLAAAGALAAGRPTRGDRARHPDRGRCRTGVAEGDTRRDHSRAGRAHRAQSSRCRRSSRPSSNRRSCASAHSPSRSSAAGRCTSAFYAACAESRPRRRWSVPTRSSCTR